MLDVITGFDFDRIPDVIRPDGLHHCFLVNCFCDVESNLVVVLDFVVGMKPNECEYLMAQFAKMNTPFWKTCWKDSELHYCTRPVREKYVAAFLEAYKLPKTEIIKQIEDSAHDSKW